MNWVKKQFKDKKLLVRKNQQVDTNCKINSLVPRMLHLRLNHTIYWLFTLLLWCRNTKPTDYRGRPSYFTVVNKLSRQNHLFDAIFSIYFSDAYFLMREKFLSKFSSNTQNDQWLWIEVKQLIMRRNKQADTDCDINRLVPSTPHSWLYHTLDWLVTVLLWCRNMIPMDCEGMSASFTEINNLSRQNRYFGACFLHLFVILILNYT